MRQTNRENRFSSNKLYRKERRTVVWFVLSTRFFSLSFRRFPLSSFVYLYTCIVQREAVPMSVDQKADLLYISFLFVVDIAAIVDAEKYRPRINSYMQKINHLCQEGRKIWNNNILPQTLTNTRLRRYLFLIHHRAKR